MFAHRTMLAAIVMLALAGCNDAKLAIRSLPGSALVENATADVRVAEGRAQLALGNVGLALESFRKAVREDPSNLEAYVGMASGYERMGRFDLAARQYEGALALAPSNGDLLERLAANREADGKKEEAGRIRRELAMLNGRSGEMPTTAEVVKAVGFGDRLSLSTVAAVAAPMMAASRSPRLVRLSLGEIALVTHPGPLWEEARQATPPPIRSVRVELLNAARVSRLAAKTREMMRASGWSDMAIGDSATVRSTSVVLYPSGAQFSAVRIAAKLGIAAKLDPAAAHIVVLLGQDAVDRVNGKRVAV